MLLLDIKQLVSYLGSMLSLHAAMFVRIKNKLVVCQTDIYHIAIAVIWLKKGKSVHAKFMSLLETI